MKQKPIPAALILSVAKYYSPGGKAIQDNAVTPNVLVASAQDELDLEEGEGEGPEAPAKPTSREDDVLRRALDLVKGKKT